jgi:hypothetical protein
MSGMVLMSLIACFLLVLVENLVICRADAAGDTVVVRAVFLVYLLAAELGEKALEGGSLIWSETIGILRILTHVFLLSLFQNVWLGI